MTPNISPEDRAALADDLKAAIAVAQQELRYSLPADYRKALEALITAARASQEAAAELAIARDQLRSMYGLPAELSALKAERDALRKDAERWRDRATHAAHLLDEHSLTEPDYAAETQRLIYEIEDALAASAPDKE